MNCIVMNWPATRNWVRGGWLVGWLFVLCFVGSLLVLCWFFVDSLLVGLLLISFTTFDPFLFDSCSLSIALRLTHLSPPLSPGIGIGRFSYHVCRIENEGMDTNGH